MAQVLQSAGYRTGLFGKWGLGLSRQPGTPGAKGFDEFFGYLNQRKAHSYYPPFLWHNTEKIFFPQHAGHQHRQQSSYDENGRVIPRGIKSPAEAHYSFDLIHERSLEFVRQNYQKPFFLYLAHTIPHGPIIVPDLGQYRDADWPLGHKEWAAMITRLDHAVGDVLSLLEELQIDGQTLIFFASDNGCSLHGYDRDRSVEGITAHFQNGGPTRGGKGNTYDGAFRVPAMARWPGEIEAGQVSDHIWAFWDVLPTTAELAGAKVPEGIDGISFVPTLLGNPENQRQHDYLYWEFRQNQAVRHNDWFAHRKNGGQVELYNLARDPQQQHDLAGENQALAAKTLAWMQQSHEPSEVWPSPGESVAALDARLRQAGVPKRPQNVND